MSQRFTYVIQTKRPYPHATDAWVKISEGLDGVFTLVSDPLDATQYANFQEAQKFAYAIGATIRDATAKSLIEALFQSGVLVAWDTPNGKRSCMAGTVVEPPRVGWSDYEATVRRVDGGIAKINCDKLRRATFGEWYKAMSCFTTTEQICPEGWDVIDMNTMKRRARREHPTVRRRAAAERHANPGDDQHGPRPVHRPLRKATAEDPDHDGRGCRGVG